jgi:putative membrane protein insertion efficiency factor
MDGPNYNAGWWNWLRQFPASLLIGLVRVYQFTLSPFIGRQCRFEPTCSHYFIACVQQEGAWHGTWRGLKRIARCHPFHPGGYDPP